MATTKTCVTCNALMDKRGKFCSSKCRVKAHRDKASGGPHPLVGETVVVGDLPMKPAKDPAKVINSTTSLVDGFASSSGSLVVELGEEAATWWQVRATARNRTLEEEVSAALEAAASKAIAKALDAAVRPVPADTGNLKPFAREDVTYRGKDAKK